MASSRASTAACATSASMSTCSQTSPRRAASSKNGGTTTTPTDRTRASTGSHQPSSQLAPRRGKTGTDSPYDRGQIGEQVIFRPERGLWYLSGYVLSKKGALALLDLLPCRGPIDLWINHKFGELDVRALRRSVVNQRR